ncbi:MAG: hypothetical protein AMXMBFR84_11940 [Candidatus Hydrogenedentota bacterium]
MRPRSLAVLTSLLILLCAGYWFTLRQEENATKRAEQAKLLFNAKLSDVTKLSILREGERPTTAVRTDDGTWRIDEPYAVPPSPGVWDDLTKLFLNLKSERTVREVPEGLEDYGLDNPPLILRAEIKGVAPVELKFGDADPTQQFRYAQLNGGPVLLVIAKTMAELDRPLLKLRDRTVFASGESGIAWLEYTPIRPRQEGDAQPAADLPAHLANAVELQSLVVALHDDAKWYIEMPEPGYADQGMVSQLVSTVQYTVSNDFIDKPENYSDYGLAPPRAKIAVRSAVDGPVQVLYLGDLVTPGNAEGGIYAKKPDSDSVMLIDGIMTALLPTDINAFREKRLLTGKATELEWLTYKSGETFVRAINDPVNGWSIAAPQAADADQITVSTLLSMLKTVEGKNLFQGDLAQYSLENPDIEIAVKYRDQAEPVKIRISMPIGDEKISYATQDTGGITSLENPVVEGMRLTVSDFISKRLLTFKPEDVQGVSVRFDGTSYRFEKGERIWTVIEPAGKILESQADMDAIIDALHKQTRAESVYSLQPAADSVALGIDSPVVEASLTLTPGTDGLPRSVGPIKIGENCPDNLRERYAVVEGRPEVFRIRQTIITELRQAFRGVRDR